MYRIHVQYSDQAFYDLMRMQAPQLHTIVWQDKNCGPL